jgi:hypothetical protein
MAYAQLKSTLAAISESTGLPVAVILEAWTSDDFREWARTERVRALADHDQAMGWADHLDRLGHDAQ